MAMTKSQMRKRLLEAKAKVMKCYTQGMRGRIGIQDAVTTADMVAIEKILDKCLNRLR